MQSHYYHIMSETHTRGCGCQQNINWSIPKFLSHGNKTGYIVQKYSRTQIPDSCINIPEYQDIAYFEAWKVDNGSIISEDEGNGCDDMFTIGRSPFFDEFFYSLQTKGSFIFRGKVFWVSSDDLTLYQLVDSWTRDEVDQTNGLKGVYECTQFETVEPVDNRDPFIHSWNLLTEENIYQAAKATLFVYCHNNTKRDRQLFDDAIERIFRGKYREIAKKIRAEWIAQFDNL